MEKAFFSTWQVSSQAVNHKATMPVGTALRELSFNCDNLEKSKSLSHPVNTESLLVALPGHLLESQGSEQSDLHLSCQSPEVLVCYQLLI